MRYLLFYALFMIGLVTLRRWGKRESIDGYLVAHRQVGGFFGSLSIAASWIWAPAIFVSSKVGYEWGYSGLLWFTVPNMLALFIFAPLAARVRGKLPNGFSYVQLLRAKQGGFHHAQLLLQLAMQVLIFALQLTAGAQLLSQLGGASYTTIVLIMTVTPLLYCLKSGLVSSIFTDTIQYLCMALGVVILYCGFLSYVPGTLRLDLSFHPLNATLLREFGISSAIGLLCAIFADHQQWQRAFAIKQTHIVRTYIWGGLLHAFITFGLGTLGVLIAGSGFQVQQTELVTPLFLQEYLPFGFLIVFVYIALCGLCSTLDSGLCAFSSLITTEFIGDTAALRTSRHSMLLLAVLGAGIALLHLPLLTLWFLAGTLRLSAFAPTILSILRPDYPGRTGTISILSGILVGGGVFAYGIAEADSSLRTLGMILSVALSTAVSLLGTQAGRTHRRTADITPNI